MGKINVLSFAVANLIAAGEVVDRPASVIKELLENAIDSGADRITVEIQNGGVTYMRVADNGCGIEPEDLPTAIRRHATSKIKEARDLDGIITLGFRGEALAAIAAVSTLRIISKTKDADVGAMLSAKNGVIDGVSERACADGTTVIVEDLFSNVPARRKFLKKDVTEAMAVSAVVEKIALSKPHIAFRLIVDGNVRIDTVGDGKLENTIYSIFGKDFSKRLIKAEIELDGIEVRGFIGRSDNVKATRNYQNFFINGRYVKSKTAMAAIEQAYTSYIPSEKFPCCILFITVNPATVDVNVHPAKLEVKFSNEKPVFEAIYYAVKNALEENVSRPEMIPDVVRTGRIEEKLSDSSQPIANERNESVKKRQMSAELYKVPAQKPENKGAEKFERLSASDYVERYVKGVDPQSVGMRREPKADVRTEETKDKEIKAIIDAIASEKKDSKQNNTNQSSFNYGKYAPSHDIPKTVPRDKAVEVIPTDAPKPEGNKLDHRIVGELFNSYVIVERGEETLIIDKHAAHERIIFEQLKKEMKRAQKTSQLLMLPIEVMLTSEEIQIISDYRDEIEAVGFEFTNGRYTVNVTAIPEGIQTDAVSDMLAVIADRIKTNTGTAELTRDIIFEKALYQASCKAAIKAGREYPEGHIKWLVSKLMELTDITVCPHGRPVAMVLSKKALDRQFERT